MSESGVRDPKWALTKEALDRFLAYLSHDRDEAARKYEEIRRITIGFFEANGCRSAEDLTDQTLDIVIRKLDDVRGLMPYIRGVARRVASESRRKRTPVSLEESGEPVAPPQPIEWDAAEDEKRLECLRRCAERLPAADRAIILDYYQFERAAKILHKQKMAEGLGVSAGALRVRAHRARQRLRIMVEDCVKSLSPARPVTKSDGDHSSSEGPR